VEINFLIVDSSVYLQVSNLTHHDPVTGDAYANTATVTATIKTLSGVDLAGTLTLAYIAASNGNYFVVVPYSLAIVAGQSYKIEITTIFSSLQAVKSTTVQAKAGQLILDESCTC
jgi:hypothetical protein